MTLETPAVVIAREDGTVMAQNAPARTMMGAGTGSLCWDVVPGLEEAEGLPCRRGCVRELLRSGLEQSQQARVLVKGRRHGLTCVPLGDSVVCMLSCAAGEAPEAWELLTGRERNVLQLLADGETSASAARKLEISPATVRTHVEHMRLKLGAKTRAALVSLGHRFGFLT
jgi:DNA-binding CsgD family transcriptional regulator